MANQQPNFDKMINKEILHRIQINDIKSRRALYKEIGRSKKLLTYLNDNNILVQRIKPWTKSRFKEAMFEMKNKLNRIPKANDSYQLCAIGQRLYGSWNNAVFTVFGEVTQKRYFFTKKHVETIIQDYVIKYQRLPLRSEFNGKEYPFYEAILKAVNETKWSNLYKHVDLSKIKYYDSYHGSGKIILYKGILYLSHEEYLIGKYLTDNNILFEKEVPYKNSNYIFDFYLIDYDVYIEYYGRHTKEYINTINKKRLKYNNRIVIEIFKHDNTIKKLSEEVQRLQSSCALVA